MRKVLSAVTGVVALLGTPFVLHGQWGAGVSVAFSVPTGDYGQDLLGTSDGLAEAGISLFGEVTRTVSSDPDVELIGTFGLTSHPVTPDFRTAALVAGASDVQVGRYWELPVLVGGRLRIPLSEGVSSIHVSGQAGLTLLKRPTVEIDDATDTYAWATDKLSFAFGAGMDLSPRVGFGVRFVSLGVVDTELDSTSGGATTESLSVSFLDFFAAIRIL